MDGNVSWELLLAIRNGNDFIDVAGELGVDKYKIIYKSIQGNLYSGNYHLSKDFISKFVIFKEYINYYINLLSVFAISYHGF